MKTKLTKRLVCFALVLVMMLGLIPITVYAEEPITPAVSGVGVVSWEDFGDDEYSVTVVNSQSQSVIPSLSVGYALSFDLKAKLDELGVPSGDYKIKITGKKGGNFVYSNQVTYSYTSSKAQLGTPTNLHWDGAVARWDAVSGATSYNVALTNGNGGTIESKIISENSYDFTENIKNGVTFKVVAKANGYLDSSATESAPSKSFAVTFAAGSGTGSKDKVVLTPAGDDVEVEYTLPSVGGFYAPDGKIFSQWSVDFLTGPQEEDPIFFAKWGEQLTVNGDVLLTATWKDEAYTVTLYANDGKGTQQHIEDVYGAYVLPDCSFEAPDGKEFDCWAIGSALGEQKIPGQGINVYDDTLIVALWKDKTFTKSPVSGSVTVNDGYKITYQLSIQPELIYLEFYNDYLGQWAANYSLAAMPESVGALTEFTVSCIHSGTAETIKFRIHATKGGVSYYSDEFTVTWVESAFASQPASVTLPLNVPALISYALNITPVSVKFEVNNGGAWEFFSGTDGDTYSILSAYDTETALALRVVVNDGSNDYYSNPFTVEWSESADACAFEEAFQNATVKVSDAYNLAWLVNFASTSQNIYVWNEEHGMWEHYDGDGEGYTVLRAANAVNNYDFQANEQTALKFKVVVSVGDDFAFESNEFTICWVSYNATFKANGGTGDDIAVGDLFGEYTLPECSFAAPDGKCFAGWAIGSAEGEVKQPGEAVEVLENTACFAIWEDYTFVDSYVRLTEAINAGKRYIKLSSSASCYASSNQEFASAILSFSGNGSTVLDLGGYTLNFNNDSNLMGNMVAWIEVLDGHKLTIKNGTMILQNNSTVTDYSAYGMIYVEDAALITENVNMQNKKYGSCVRADSGIVTLNGGELKTLSGWAVFAMYDVALTLDGDVCLCLQNHGAASASVAGGLYVMTDDTALDIRKAHIKDGMSIPKTMCPTLETHVFYVNGARIHSELGTYATNALAVAAGSSTYWLDQGNRIYLADAGDGDTYLANECVVLTSKAVKHSITVENGQATVGGNPVTEGYYTQEITVTANPPEGKIFDYWDYECEIGIVFADAHSATTTFEMVDCEIKLIPVYRNAPITHIDITFSEPIVGEEFSRYAAVDHEGLVIATGANGHPEWDIEWSCLTDSMSAMEKGAFLPGKEYKAALRVEVANGDWEIDDHASLYVTINGVVAELGFTSSTVAVIYTTFTMAMTNFEAPFTNDSRAGLGGWLEIDTAWLNEYSSEFANAESIEYIWYKNDTIFYGATGSSYKIKPEDAYSKICVMIKVTRNGVDYYGLSESKIVSNKVVVVSINLAPIEGGCYIPYNSHKQFHAVDTELGSVKMVVWYNDTMVELEEGTTLLETGEEYTLYLVYQLKEEYVWDNDVAFCFNGGELVPSDSSDPVQKTLRKYLLDTEAVAHTHTYEKGICGYDDDGHWFRCDNENCANRDEEYDTYVDHVSNDATCQATGSCAICGKTGIEGTHDFEGGEYVKTSEEYHETKCLYCDVTDGLENPHFGGTATCTARAICEGCGEAYGEPTEHPGYTQAWDYKDENGHAHVCIASGCNAHDELQPHIPGAEATEDEPQICTACGYVIVPATGHVTCSGGVKQNGQAASCTVDGWKDYYKCAGCENLFEDAACTVAITDLVAWKLGAGRIAAAHDYGELVTRVEAIHTSTELSAGMQAYYFCDVCDTYFTEQKVVTTEGELVIPAPVHSYTVENGYKDENGHANACECGAHATPLTSHIPGAEATEDEPQICTACGYIIVPATGHVTCSGGVKQNGQAASCTVDGWKDYYKCAGCENLFEDAACTVAITDLVAWKLGTGRIAAAHDYGELIAQVDATCSATGKQAHYNCAVCHTLFDEGKTVKTENELKIAIDANAHSYGAWTANGDGTHTRVCGLNAEHEEVSDCAGGTASCTAQAVCSVCGTAYGALAPHTPNADDGDCTTDILCSVCSAVTTEGADAHTGGTASCTAKAVCSVCGTAYGALAPHVHTSEWSTDASNHWNECACGDKANVAAHADTDGDGKCDACAYTMSSGETATPVPPNTPNTPNTPDMPEENDGLSGGAIAGIVIGSVVVAGGGGFALVWFVIKKKTWAEFLAIFKKG